MAMLSAVDIAVLALLGAWFAASAAVQVSDAWQRRVRPYDVLRVVRRYDVFAPDPELLQVRAWMRCVGPDGVVGPWVPVERYPRPTLVRTLWNPRYLGEFVLAGDCAAVARALSELPEGAVERLFAFRRVRGLVLARSACDVVHFRVSLVATSLDGAESEEVVGSAVWARDAS